MLNESIFFTHLQKVIGIQAHPSGKGLGKLMGTNTQGLAIVYYSYWFRKM